jgi:hypothetical protein
VVAGICQEIGLAEYLDALASPCTRRAITHLLQLNRQTRREAGWLAVHPPSAGGDACDFPGVVPAVRR